MNTPARTPSSSTITIMGAVLTLLALLVGIIGVLSSRPLPADQPLEEKSIIVK